MEHAVVCSLVNHSGPAEVVALEGLIVIVEKERTRRAHNAWGRVDYVTQEPALPVPVFTAVIGVVTPQIIYDVLNLAVVKFGPF